MALGPETFRALRFAVLCEGPKDIVRELDRIAGAKRSLELRLQFLWWLVSDNADVPHPVQDDAVRGELTGRLKDRLLGGKVGTTSRTLPLKAGRSVVLWLFL